jgi:putative transposase
MPDGERGDRRPRTSLALVRDYDAIVHEDLQLSNMTGRLKPRPEGSSGHQPNGAAAKAGLSESIQDAGWGIFSRLHIVQAGLTRQQAQSGC